MNQRTTAIGAAAFLMILPITFVAMRFCARIRSLAKVGMDDWLILFALVFFQRTRARTV